MWKMDPNEILLSRGGGGGNSNGTAGEGFIDRSKVRILLCDNNLKSSEEVFHLLCKCSYQVTSVRSPRQVIDALNAEGPDIDIILSEVDLPMAKGFKMLKYIMRDNDLRRIPVIMMSAQDEVALVVKCLRLGAADYLVKPLRTNELLNLWTHMWRRRRMLGLAEKNIMNCEFDPVQSDHSEANTNSTTLFSDDTDDKSHKTSNPEVSVSVPQENETSIITPHGLINTPLVNLSDDPPNVPEINEQLRGKVMFGPKKSELRIGQSSAFFTYVKSSAFRGDTHVDEANPPALNINPTDENAARYEHAMPAGMPTWHSYGNSSNHNAKVHKLDRRQAALIKFKQKRKERCFDKKIRYVNRKKLAERRPRVRGQFVRKVNGINVDLNGQPTSTDFDDEDDDDDDDEEEEDHTGSENNYAVFNG
ncbi:putative response regulator and transcription factor RR-A-type family [Helianthus annuus]|nr:putative response regulator and transcription factor RR-A-type family [Helianthus annuus]